MEHSCETCRIAYEETDGLDNACELCMMGIDMWEQKEEAGD